MKTDRILTKDEANTLVRKLIPISVYKNDGFLLTDLNKAYHACKSLGYSDDKFHPESIWAHNQSWVLIEVDEEIKLPAWFKNEMYTEALNFKNEVCADIDGYIYNPNHNGYTGSIWYSSNVIDAVRNCIYDWSPIWGVNLTPGTKIYDNGVNMFTEKPVQIWKYENTYALTFFHSNKNKKLNTEGFSDNAIQMVKYATNNPKSKWRSNKRWTKFLKFNDPIGPFTELASQTISDFAARVTESIETAQAGEYILAKFEWGGMFNGEGDSGEELFIFESQQELNDFLIERIGNNTEQN